MWISCERVKDSAYFHMILFQFEISAFLLGKRIRIQRTNRFLYWINVLCKISVLCVGMLALCVSNVCFWAKRESGHQISSRCEMHDLQCFHKMHSMFVFVFVRDLSRANWTLTLSFQMYMRNIWTQQLVTCLQAHLKRFSRFYSEINCIIFVQANSFVNSVHQIEQIFNEFNEISWYLFGFAWFPIFTGGLLN